MSTKIMCFRCGCRVAKTKRSFVPGEDRNNPHEGAITWVRDVCSVCAEQLDILESMPHLADDEQT